MSKINELIKQKCPAGVEHRPLWSLTTWDKKFNAVDKLKQPKVLKYYYYLANDLKPLINDNGDIKILTTSESKLYTTEELVELGTIADQEVIAIPWGGNPIVQYYKGKFITADNRIAISNDTSVLDTKFLYYILVNRLDEVSSFYRGSGIKHPSMTKILDLFIPVPPIEIQKEIVKVLDNFTKYDIELQAELQARIKQYEHYRDKLLSFDNLAAEGQVEWCTIGELCTVSAGGDIPKNNFSNKKTCEYSVPIVSNGVKEKAFCGYTDSARVSEPAVTISARGTIGYVEYRSYPYYPVIRLLSAIPTDVKTLNTKYLYYCLQGRAYKYPASGIPQLTAPDFRKQKILVPPLATQERIVNILDQFSDICNNLESGLPAEIAARQKQYAYYRNALLTFKKLPAKGGN